MTSKPETEKSQTLGFNKTPSAKNSAAKPIAKKNVKGSSKTKEQGEKKSSSAANTSNYPRHSLEKALRIPKAILEQNAGKEVTDIEAAKFLGITNTKGPFSVELSSSLKYGFLEKPGKA